MEWSALGTQFCLELAFGVLLGLALIPKAPLGVFFQRLMGTTAFLPLAAAAVLPPMYGGSDWTDGAVLAALAGMLAFPVVLAPIRTSTRFRAFTWGTACAGLSLVLTVRAAPEVTGAGALVLGSLSAMATGTVAGVVGLAMVVGHWYLTVPQLPISWLQRLNRITAVAMIASALFVTISCIAHAEMLREAETPLLSSFGLFFLSARVLVGLALPLLFAWMTAGSLEYKNTRSATGILYASTVLVLIGTAVSISLQDTYGIPL
jgi:hypothetical protein